MLKFTNNSGRLTMEAAVKNLISNKSIIAISKIKAILESVIARKSLSSQQDQTKLSSNFVYYFSKVEDIYKFEYQIGQYKTAVEFIDRMVRDAGNDIAAAADDFADDIDGYFRSKIRNMADRNRRFFNDVLLSTSHLANLENLYKYQADEEIEELFTGFIRDLKKAQQ